VHVYSWEARSSLALMGEANGDIRLATFCPYRAVNRCVVGRGIAEPRLEDR
jgi:hypothetical protein